MENFREQLVEIINTTQLPFECKFYVLKDVFNEVREVYKQQLELRKKQEHEIKNNNEEEQNSSSSND